MQTIGSRTSDAGPESAPMDLTDWCFEAEWRSELANEAHKRGRPKDYVRALLESAKEAAERALELL